MNNTKKTIIITGGAGRIGLALAKDLLRHNYNVLLGDISRSKLLKIKKKLSSKNLEIFSGDLTVKNNIEKFINYGKKKFKKIDGAVHCSYPRSKKWGATIEKLDEVSLKKDLYNQLGGTIIFCQAIIKYFKKVKKGNLILLSSIQGFNTPKFEHYKNLNMTSPIEYSAIKSGRIAITKYLAKYYQNLITFLNIY